MEVLAYLTKACVKECLQLLIFNNPVPKNYRGYGVIVASLPGDVGIGERISNLLGAQHQEVIHKVFPDGESYLRFPHPIESDDYVLVQSTYPEQNRRLLELVMAAKTLSVRGARSVSAVIPYLAYARQDKEFLPGEVVSAEVVLELLGSSGISDLYVVDIHKPAVLKAFRRRSTNIMPLNSFKKYMSGLNLRNPLVVAPDEGARHRASLLSKALSTDYLVIKKFRDRYTGKILHSFPEGLDFGGVDVVVIDDIISTGGTVADIASKAKDLGAERVFALATHGIFVDGAVERLRNSGIDEVIVAKTVGRVVEGVTYVDVGDEVANVVGRRFL